MSWRYDPELDELFVDPEERRMAAILSSVQAPQVEPDPAFRSQLRRELMDRAWKRSEPRLPWWRRLSAPAPAAWGMATVGALLIALAVYVSMHPGAGGQTIVVSYNVDQTQPMAAVRPLDVTFSQPMDRQSVEQAVQITPATAVTYSWVSDREVKIQPVAGSFAPNTQYTVALQPNVAHSQTGSVVTDPKPAVFTVAPTPAPTPSATPTPTPSAAPIAIQALGGAQPVRPVWPGGGAIVYVNAAGQLVEQSPGSTVITQLGPSGVQAIALRPDGQAILALAAGGAVSEVSLASRTVTPVAAAGPVLAAAYDSTGRPVLATAATVGPAQAPPSAGPSPAPASGQHPLDSSASAAWLSPHATALVYRSALGLRAVDLATGKETAWPATTATTATVLGWSPDEKQLLYSTPDGLFASTPSGGSPATLAHQPAVAADWSRDGALVYGTSAGTFVVAADGSGARQLSTTGFQAVSWEPGSAAFAYFSTGAGGAGTMAVATLAQPPPAPAPVGTADQALQTVSTFMAARVAGQADAARAELDTAGQAAYGSGAALLFTGDPKLERWFPVATVSSADGVRVDARLVLADSHGRDVAQLDELLTVVRGAGGGYLIHAVAATPSRPYGKGPEVIGVRAAAQSVAVEFDSDLDAAGVADSVVLLDAAGKRVAAGKLNGTREVDLALPATLAPGVYRLKVLTGLHDRDGRPAAAEFTLDLALGTAPSVPAAPPAQPSPVPVPTPS